MAKYLVHYKKVSYMHFGNFCGREVFDIKEIYESFNFDSISVPYKNIERALAFNEQANARMKVA